MTTLLEYQPNDHGDQRLRLRCLEYQVRALASAVADLASAVDALAFASAEPHAAVALGRVNKTLAEIGVETAGVRHRAIRS